MKALAWVVFNDVMFDQIVETCKLCVDTQPGTCGLK